MTQQAVKPCQFVLDPGPGVVTLAVTEDVYRAARRLTDDHGCHLRIKALAPKRPHGWDWELRIDDGHDVPIITLRTGETQVGDTAGRLLRGAIAVLEAPPPW